MNEPKQLPFEGSEDPVFLACSYVLKRNIAKHCFPHKMDKAARQSVLDWAKTALADWEMLDTLDGAQRERLTESYLLDSKLQHFNEGSGVFLSGPLFMGINLSDHVVIRGMAQSKNAQEVWNQVLAIEEKLGCSMDFAYHPRFGFLTSNPHECGTTLEMQTYLHLPALLNFGNISEALSREEGVRLEQNDSLGSIAILTNPETFGVTEDHIIHSVHGATLKLANAEKTFRDHLGEHADVKDKVMRAFGLLTHSYQLELKETLDALSLIKLGIDLGLATGMESHAINPLFTKVHRGHLQGEDLAHERATFVHEALKPLNVPE
ncbi:MAG: Protein-arginine kinase [Chlamydiia bacterium]|nr:Protein-arginine kinase [Chlamydiia bacterium]MCH9616232.1 Protein-arginine kinase [Chlamydiia bacterium]MCH9629782.1 Protein-arginine kinase [Chlamydiia bacterium]